MIPPMDYTTDVRLKHDHVVRENWSHEEVGPGGWGGVGWGGDWPWVGALGGAANEGRAVA
jgi:hypothetical protein